ncbi:MAG: hypothetical protein HY711_05455 [Candidatus Melainabacteria bacterium]|nr:hypothetical protein [Candidatus Melainabacteria bacterium]
MSNYFPYEDSLQEPNEQLDDLSGLLSSFAWGNMEEQNTYQYSTSQEEDHLELTNPYETTRSYGFVKSPSYGLVDAPSFGLVETPSYGLVDAPTYGLADNLPIYRAPVIDGPVIGDEPEVYAPERDWLTQGTIIDDNNIVSVPEKDWLTQGHVVDEKPTQNIDIKPPKGGWDPKVFDTLMYGMKILSGGV